MTFFFRTYDANALMFISLPIKIPIMSIYPNCSYQLVCVFLRQRKREMSSITTNITSQLHFKAT